MLSRCFIISFEQILHLVLMYLLLTLKNYVLDGTKSIFKTATDRYLLQYYRIIIMHNLEF